jgi:hypothetical protein
MERYDSWVVRQKPKRQLFSGSDDDLVSNHNNDDGDHTALNDGNNTSSTSSSSHPSAYDTNRIEIRNGYPVRYKCLDYAATTSLDHRGRNYNHSDAATAGVVVANVMVVSFKYEVTLSSSQNTDFTSSMLELEWSILWNVVQELGLNRCDFTKQTQAWEHLTSSLIQQDGNVGTKLSTSTINLNTFNTTSSYVLSLSSDDQDAIDMEAGTNKPKEGKSSLSECLIAWIHCEWGGCLLLDPFNSLTYS